MVSATAHLLVIEILIGVVLLQVLHGIVEVDLAILEILIRDGEGKSLLRGIQEQENDEDRRQNGDEKNGNRFNGVNRRAGEAPLELSLLVEHALAPFELDLGKEISIVSNSDEGT